MDTRFVKVRNIRYPLYKRASSLRFFFKVLLSRKKDLKRMIADIFKVKTNNVVLFNSESEAIIKILSYHKNHNNINKVYIPAFSCTELVDSVISSECIPVLYEIDKDLNPSFKTLQSIEGRKDLILILPALFGKNLYSKKFQEYLKRQEYIVIFDEAQSFPIKPRMCYESKKKWYSVVSFGPSKPIGSVGGGALISHFESRVLKEEYNKSDKKYTLDLMMELRDIVKNKFCSQYMFRKFLDKRKLYSSLQELQANSTYTKKEVAAITPFQEKCAAIRISEYKKSANNKEVLLVKNKLILAFENELGKESRRLIKSKIENQGTIALFIDRNIRHQVAEKLAEKGIQTTLYYLPIILIDRYKGIYVDAVKDEEYKNSIEIIESILILPCNLDYRKKDIAKMINDVKGALR